MAASLGLLALSGCATTGLSGFARRICASGEPESGLAGLDVTIAGLKALEQTYEADGKPLPKWFGPVLSGLAQDRAAIELGCAAGSGAPVAVSP